MRYCSALRCDGRCWKLKAVPSHVSNKTAKLSSQSLLYLAGEEAQNFELLPGIEIHRIGVLSVNLLMTGGLEIHDSPSI